LQGREKYDMLTTREEFYKTNLIKYLEKEATILVCGGGADDKKAFESCGFRNVTISNISSEMASYNWEPYTYNIENAESLSFPDNSFDYVVIHEAIHHASSPHRMVTEMYRVARKGVMATEARDSFVMRVMIKLNFTQDYEYFGIYLNGFTGGVNNTEIPNFIYRWTEREIEKTIKSYAPYAKHTFKYNYATRFPFLLKHDKKGFLKYIALRMVQPIFGLFTLLFKSQQNLFCFYIEKPKIPQDIFDWIAWDESTNRLTYNKEWAKKRYGEVGS
jgi:ubiquinone/menaquinone biosynthesis C-methylase UbiE